MLKINSSPDIEIKCSPDKLERGKSSTLRITLKIPKGFHIQAHKPAEELLIPTIITIKDSEGVTFGELIYPKPFKLPTSWSEVELLVYEGNIDILLPVTVAKDAPLGKLDVNATLSYQGCTTNMCLPPKKQNFNLSLTIL